MPKVSIVVPAYNAERYLEECLTSLLAQSFTDREVIVVDDGSTDGTGAIAERLGPHVRCQRQANQGVAGALNTGIGLATGDYVSLVAADDGLCPGATELQAGLLDRYPDAGMVHGGAEVIDASGRTLELVGRRDGVVRHVPSARALRAFLRRNTVICSSVMVRRACFEELGGFRQEFVPGEDWELWLRIAARYAVVEVDRPVARRRLHGGSLTAGFTVESVGASHERILRALFVDGRAGSGLETYAYAANDRTLAGVAAGLRQRGAFARHLARALRQQPSLLLEAETWNTLAGGAKTLLPRPFVSAASRLRHGGAAASDASG